MERSRNEKCNSLCLLIHSLPSKRRSIVDVVTLETVNDYYYFQNKIVHYLNNYLSM
jgi:hypothetical protein